MAGEKVSSVLLITHENVTLDALQLSLRGLLGFTRIYAHVLRLFPFSSATEQLPTLKHCHYHFNATGLIIHSLTVRRWQRNRGPRFPRSKRGSRSDKLRNFYERSTLTVLSRDLLRNSEHDECTFVDWRSLHHPPLPILGIWIIGLIFPRDIFIFRCTYRRFDTRKRRGYSPLAIAFQ